jgi:hypothetical protein
MARRDLEAQVRRRGPVIGGVALLILAALFFVSPAVAAVWLALLVLGAGIAFWPKTKESDGNGESGSKRT